MSRSIGTRADYRWFVEMPTRWMDNDVYGHVNNVTYYSFFDTAVARFLIANGVLVTRALEAADMLAGEGVQARVLNMSTVRPLDTAAVLSAAAETGGIVTAEEHTVHGGLGSAVA